MASVAGALASQGRASKGKRSNAVRELNPTPAAPKDNKGGHRARKPVLDPSPPNGEVGVARRQCPDRMDVIGQDDDGIDRKRIAFARLAHGYTEIIDMLDEQGAPALQQIDREEPASARNEGTAIVRHR